MYVPVTVTGSRVDYAPLEQLAADVQDMSIPLAYIGDRLREGVAEQFATQGGWGGRPWKQLTEVYRKWKATRGPGLPILIGLRSTGSKGSRPQTYAPSGKMRVELITPSAVTITPKRMLYAPVSDIAGFHQEGTPKMAARPPVVLPLRELSEWDRAFDDWLTGLVDGANA